VIDRRFAHFLDCKDQHDEALNSAQRAAEAAKGSQRCLALVTLGTMHLHAGDVQGAVESCTQALRLIRPDSPYYLPARANLMDALSKSGPEDLARAIAMLPAVEKGFLGVREVSVLRAKFCWMSGGATAKHSIVMKLRPWDRKRGLAKAKHDLSKAVAGLERKDLPLDVAAARIDLAAVQLLMDPLEVAETLDGIQDVAALERLKSFAVELANETCSLETIAKLWETLREMRDATVAAGCDPPLVPYAV
jgi:hypothetical protein